MFYKVVLFSSVWVSSCPLLLFFFMALLNSALLCFVDLSFWSDPVLKGNGFFRREMHAFCYANIALALCSLRVNKYKVKSARVVKVCEGSLL